MADDFESAVVTKAFGQLNWMSTGAFSQSARNRLTLGGAGSRFMSFVKTYTEHFRSYRHNVSDKARQYASGLMQAGSRKNIDRMAEVVPDSKSRNL